MAVKRGSPPAAFRNTSDAASEAGVDEALTLGDALRAAREAGGRSMAELAVVTRVPPRYLTAIEQNDFSILPNRVFSIGYVRAYAGALGLDEQAAVERFKRETPDPSVPLQPPVGIAFEDVKRNSPRIIAGVCVLLLAVVGWNVFQRVSMIHAPQPSDLVQEPPGWREGGPATASVRLAAPQPAPADQTLPALYVTPGLEAQMVATDPDGQPLTPSAPVQKAFNPRGALYGAPASASRVVIQASKSANIVIRFPDSRVLFARQLAAGDAWRAPLEVSATVDVSDPTAFDVYLNGEYVGPLAAAQTPLSQLNARARTQADAQARQSAAEESARVRRAEAAAAAAAQAAPAPVTVQAPAIAPPASPAG